jgi:hypothetical protein
MVVHYFPVIDFFSLVLRVGFQYQGLASVLKPTFYKFIIFILIKNVLGTGKKIAIWRI